MSLASIQQALLERAIVAIGNRPTEFENIAFDTPSDGTSWAKVNFLPNDPRPISIGLNGYDEYDGLLQIDFNTKVNTGDKEQRDFYSQIRSYFTGGTKLVYNGQYVLITRCGRSQGRQIDGWYRVSTSAYWYAQVPR